MRRTIVLNKKENLPSYLKEGVTEFILPVQGFSRLPVFSKKEALDYIAQSSKGIRFFLEWDILMTEEHFQNVLSNVAENFLKSFSAIRVQDIGAFNYLLKNEKDIPLHLILEHGNHNFESLYSFSLISPQIERLVLSPQIPGSLLKRYSERLPCPIEILYRGPLMLSYTPRHLLRRLNENFVTMTNLEGQAPKLKAIDNENGTFVLHGARFSLEARKDELEQWTNINFRIDTRLEGNDDLVTDGFFEKNASTEVFVHLKNAIIEREDRNYVGDVVDVIREKYIGIVLSNSQRVLKKGDTLIFKTPEGRIKEQLVTDLFDFLLTPVEFGNNGEIVFIPHRGVVSVRSSVYFKED